MCAVQRAFGYALQLPELVRTARLDLLHLNGIWQYPSRVARKFADHSGLPLVISPHRMLDPWITRRNAWKKHLGRWLWERSARDVKPPCNPVHAAINPHCESGI